MAIKQTVLEKKLKKMSEMAVELKSLLDGIDMGTYDFLIDWTEARPMDTAYHLENLIDGLEQLKKHDKGALY